MSDALVWAALEERALKEERMAECQGGEGRMSGRYEGRRKRKDVDLKATEQLYSNYKFLR